MKRTINNYQVTYFIVHVRLKRELKRFEIFKKKYAQVYAIINDNKMDSAEDYLRMELEKREYKILKIHSKGNYDDFDWALPKLTQIHIKYAKRDGHHISFYRLSKSEINEIIEGVKAINITSRYCNNPDVTIDLSNVPEELHKLIPCAKTWAIC